MMTRRLQRISRAAGLKIALATAIILFFSHTLMAQMNEVTDDDLSQVFAQAGVSYNWVNSKLSYTADTISFSDTDGTKDWLEFNNFSVTGPIDGQYFTLDSLTDSSEYLYLQHNTMDVATGTTVDNASKTFYQMVTNEHKSPRTYTIGNLVFCGQDLGSLQFDSRNLDPTFIRVAGQSGEGQGLEFEYLSNWRIENFNYAYNTSGGSLGVTGINLAEYASGAADNPADPLTWEFTGHFRIGDMLGGVIDVDNDPGNQAVPNPATFDVDTTSDETNVTTCAYLNLPMKGSIRAAAVNMGGNNFGPVAIDGIVAHRLYIKINPGD